MSPLPSSWSYERLRELVRGEHQPLMLVDLDSLDDNIDRVRRSLEHHDKRLRVASKSIRVPALIRHVIERSGRIVEGIMCYSPAEAHFLAERGFDDLLVAYPRVQRADVEHLWAMRTNGTRVIAMVDEPAHLERLSAFWEEKGAGSGTPDCPVCVDMDCSYRPFGGVHLGAHRSPLRTPEEVVEFADRVRGTDHLRLSGIMGYEAQVAGLTDENPHSTWTNPVKKLVKSRSVPSVARRRAEVAERLESRGLELEFFNGGGTGSLETTAREEVVTEVTVGSGFLQSRLFDYYESNRNDAAFCFALNVTRVPQPDTVTCQSGGFIASGEPGEDKTPEVILPEALSPVGGEGFGEVQTPLKGPAAKDLSPGDPVFLRPAKAGEIAEHFTEYLLFRGGEIVDRVPTYRGDGGCFY